jgi:hypothetical protein
VGTVLGVPLGQTYVLLHIENIKLQACSTDEHGLQFFVIPQSVHGNIMDVNGNIKVDKWMF